MVVAFLTGFTEIAPVQKSRHLRNNVKLFVMIVEVNRHATFYTIIYDAVKMVLRQYMDLVLGKNSLESFHFFDPTLM